VDLRRARHALPPGARAGLDAVLDGLAAEYRTRAGAVRYEASHLTIATLDHALTDATSLPPGRETEDMLQGLVGIRLGLFPDAPGYLPPADSIPVLERAA
jgi:hypothetical protein